LRGKSGSAIAKAEAAFSILAEQRKRTKSFLQNFIRQVRSLIGEVRSNVVHSGESIHRPD
jgi:hypothetical protein